MTESNSDARGPLRYLPYLLLALALALAAYVRIRLLQVPLERDEGEYALMGQLLLDGAPPYAFAYSMKLPGVSAMYALFMTLFGQSAFAIHLGLLIVNALSTLLVYPLAARVLNRDAAALSCASYALLSLSKTVYGPFAHATQFIVLFALAGFVLLLGPGTGSLEKGCPPAPAAGRPLPVLFLSGLCFGLAFVMKQPALLLGLFAFIYLVGSRRAAVPPPPAGGGQGAGEAGTAESAAKGGGPAAAALLLFLAGLALPYLVVLLWVLKAGSFDNFWFWTVTYAREYASSQPLAEGLRTLVRAVTLISTPQLPLWLLAAAGLCFLAAGRVRGANRLFIAGFLACSFLAVCPGLYFRWHYFILILPAVALLIGAAGSALGDLAGSTKGKGALRFLVPALVVGAAIGYGFYKERVCFFLLSPVQVSYSSYGSSPFPAAAEVGAYLKGRTSAGDTVAVLGSEPEIYFHSGRRPATGHIYMYGLMEDHPYAGRMQSEMMRQIEEAKPKYCVFSKTDYSWLVGPNSRRDIFHWIERYLKDNYEQVGVVELYPDRSVCVWDAAAAGYAPRCDEHLIVYRRKG